MIVKKKAANILFYDKEGNFMLQDREGISKWGEEFHFFGGHVEEGESAEETLKRELMEELNYEIKDHELFKVWPHISEAGDIEWETSVFIAPIPSLDKLKITDGKVAIMKFEEAMKCKMVRGYNELIKEVYDKVSEN